MAGDSWVTETASEVNVHMSQIGLTRLLCELLGVGILFVLFFVILEWSLSCLRIISACHQSSVV